MNEWMDAIACWIKNHLREDKLETASLNLQSLPMLTMSLPFRHLKLELAQRENLNRCTALLIQYKLENVTNVTRHATDQCGKMWGNIDLYTAYLAPIWLCLQLMWIEGRMLPVCILLWHPIPEHDPSTTKWELDYQVFFPSILQSPGGSFTTGKLVWLK